MKDFNFQLFGVLRGSTLRFDGSPLLFLTFYSNQCCRCVSAPTPFFWEAQPMLPTRYVVWHSNSVESKVNNTTAESKQQLPPAYCWDRVKKVNKMDTVNRIFGNFHQLNKQKFFRVTTNQATQLKLAIWDFTFCKVSKISFHSKNF